MKIIESPLEAYAHVDHWRKENLRIGLVPTMGALHQGHFSLVERSRDECDLTLATIFVNPTQFAPHEDLDQYPRTIEQDFEGLKARGTDLVFVPKPESIYPDGFSTYVKPPELSRELEGEHRPDHFQGVATIVMKLFQMLPAHQAYFGQKDYQQLAVIQKMVEDLNVPIRVVGCPTIRDEDGLALSSRNRYLSPDERLRALSLNRALRAAQTQVRQGLVAVAELEKTLLQELQGQVDAIDYACVVDAKSLRKIATVESEAVALIAARVGSTRLIDNQLLEETD